MGSGSLNSMLVRKRLPLLSMGSGLSDSQTMVVEGALSRQRLSITTSNIKEKLAKRHHQDEIIFGDMSRVFAHLIPLTTDSPENTFFSSYLAVFFSSFILYSPSSIYNLFSTH